MFLQLDDSFAIDGVVLLLDVFANGLLIMVIMMVRLIVIVTTAKRW